MANSCLKFLLDDKVLYIVYNYLIDSYDKHKLIKPYYFQIFNFLKIHA